jgi:hypothetical protein
MTGIAKSFPIPRTSSFTAIGSGGG